MNWKSRIWRTAGFLLAKFAMGLSDERPKLEDMGLYIDSDEEPAAFVAEKMNISLEELRYLLNRDFLDPLDNISKKEINFL